MAKPGKAKSIENYRPFSKLTREEKAEVMADSVYRRYALRIRADDWKFMKTAKGWATNR